MSCEPPQFAKVGDTILPTVELSSRKNIIKVVTIPAVTNQRDLEDKWFILFTAQGPNVQRWMAEDLDGVGFDWSYEASDQGNEYQIVAPFGIVRRFEDVQKVWVRHTQLNTPMRIQFVVQYSPLKSLDSDRTLHDTG